MLLDQQSENKSVFQTHQGLHRMEHLHFGPTVAIGIFHGEVCKAFGGLAGYQHPQQLSGIQQGLTKSL